MVDFGGLNDAGTAIGLGGWRSLVNNGASCCKTRRLASPVLRINNHETGVWRTKDILGGLKGWGPKKKVANVEIYVILRFLLSAVGGPKPISRTGLTSIINTWKSV